MRDGVGEAGNRGKKDFLRTANNFYGGGKGGKVAGTSLKISSAREIVTRRQQGKEVKGKEDLPHYKLLTKKNNRGTMERKTLLEGQKQDHRGGNLERKPATADLSGKRRAKNRKSFGNIHENRG